MASPAFLTPFPFSRPSIRFSHHPQTCSPRMSTTFRKYHGLGNDFILINNHSQSRPLLTSSDCIPLLDRRTGIGGDGVIFLLPPQDQKNDVAMEIINPDGSIPEMCGNGLRCLVRFAKDVGIADKKDLRVETRAGVMIGEIMREEGNVTEVRVNMGKAQVGEVEGILDVWGRRWRWTEVSMGNPHCVVFLDGDGSELGNGLSLEEVDVRLEEIGRLFECHERFPHRTNTHFVSANKGELRVVHWERGAGRTRACGTGACACAVAAVVTGKAKKEEDVKVVVPGGPLTIRWLESGEVLMSGPGEFVFEGRLAAKIKEPALAGSRR